MTFKELQNQKIIAMKSKNELENKVLTLVIANVKNAAIDKKCIDNIGEDLVNEVLLKELKAAKESVNSCPEDRIELLAEYTSRCLILEKYAPKLISDEKEIFDFLNKLSNMEDIALVKKNRGAIMKYISVNCKNQFDMAAVNKVLGSILK